MIDQVELVEDETGNWVPKHQAMTARETWNVGYEDGYRDGYEDGKKAILKELRERGELR